MSLLDEGRALHRGKGSVCSVAAVRDAVGPDEFDEAMASDVETSAINRALQARGFTLSKDTLGRHRKGDCKCPR